MKKLAIGCAVVIVLCMIGFGAVAYYVYYKAHQVMESARQFAQITELDKNVTNRASFASPASGELTDDQVRRFASVQEYMRAKLGQRIQELSAKQDAIQRLQREEHRDANISEVLGAVRDLAGLMLDAKNAQVDALNASHFSLQEYNWVRTQVYTAGGMAAAQVNWDNIQDLMKKNGSSDADIEQLKTEVPEKNRTLVKPYVEKMKDWMPFAFFGL
jgi:cytochrome c556